MASGTANTAFTKCVSIMLNPTTVLPRMLPRSTFRAVIHPEKGTRNKVSFSDRFLSLFFFQNGCFSLYSKQHLPSTVMSRAWPQTTALSRWLAALRLQPIEWKGSAWREGVTTFEYSLFLLKSLNPPLDKSQA